MQSDTAARLRSAGLAALAPGVLAAAATAVVAGAAPANAEGPASQPASPSQPSSVEVERSSVSPQPLRARFERRNVLSGGRVPVKGTLLTRQGGRRILLEANAGHGWHIVDRGVTGPRGRFHLRFRPHGLGSYRMRVRLVGPVAAAGALARPAKAHAHGTVTAYRQSVASWYGPGFIGGRTACGGTLGEGTLGVANKTLPCGTRVTLHYHGRTVTARVVDRGPYVAGRDWDLTPAVKARLGFPSTGTVWSTR